MFKLVMKSMTREQEQKIQTGSAVEHIAGSTACALALAVLAVLLAATAAYAQSKYALKSPGGIAFSDFRGYEDWAAASSARADGVLKVIVANPLMIKAYKAGIPGNGRPFPGWLQDREAPVEAKDEHGSTLRRGGAGRLFPGFRYGKGQ